MLNNIIITIIIIIDMEGLITYIEYTVIIKPEIGKVYL